MPLLCVKIIIFLSPCRRSGYNPEARERRAQCGGHDDKAGGKTISWVNDSAEIWFLQFNGGDRIFRRLWFLGGFGAPVALF